MRIVTRLTNPYQVCHSMETRFAIYQRILIRILLLLNVMRFYRWVLSTHLTYLYLFPRIVSGSLLLKSQQLLTDSVCDFQCRRIHPQRSSYLQSIQSGTLTFLQSSLVYQLVTIFIPDDPQMIHTQ
jgi:hypothetical protein